MRISDWSSDVCSSDLCFAEARLGMVKVAAAASNARLIPSFFKICSFKHKLHHSTSACNVVYGSDVNAARNSSTLCLPLVSAIGNKLVSGHGHPATAGHRRVSPPLPPARPQARPVG